MSTINMATKKLDQDNNMLLISHLYPAVYPQIVPQQGETKPRRRRKKSKGGETSSLSGVKKRKLSAEQVNLLEQNFGNEHKLESERKDKIALELGLDPRQVAVWFQNRRARWKNKKLEEEYTKLKASHESIVVEKCHLETEVLKLKEQLLEAEKEIQRLSERIENSTNNSPITPTSSLSMEQAIHETPFLGEFGTMEEYEEAFYMPQTNYIINGMDWVNLYI